MPAFGLSTRHLDLLTDYLIKSFERSVIQPLGLDRYPELRGDEYVLSEDVSPFLAGEVAETKP